MSATTTQPMTGQANQSAPIGAVVILVGAIALGAVGIAIGQGYKATPASVDVSADVQAALIAHRMGEKAPLWSIEEVLAAHRASERAPLYSIEEVLAAHRASEREPLFFVADPIKTQLHMEARDSGAVTSKGSGPATGAQKGLGGWDVIGPEIVNGTATQTHTGPVRRGHYRD